MHVPGNLILAARIDTINNFKLTYCYYFITLMTGFITFSFPPDYARITL